MHDYNKTDLINSLKKVGLKNGDSLFLTIGLGMLGVPETKNKNYLLVSSRWIFNGIIKIIGKNGNIFVPTYSYSFAKKKKIFDLTKTKSDIGYFPNFFLRQKKIIRSSDPMMSIAGFGPDVKKILYKIPNNSFGKNCVFERLFSIKKLKCCHIGLGYNWIPFLHYLDWINKVPFRFNKNFYGFIKKNSKKKKTKWTYFARYLRKETLSNGYKIGLLAVKKKLYSKTSLGKSKIYLIDYKKFFILSKKLTKKNKWLTVNGPKFINKY
jgi:aminoglycoside 3-N-acetyltransferase